MPLVGFSEKNQVGLANISLRKESRLSSGPSPCPLVRAWLIHLCPESEVMGCSEPSTWPEGPLSHLSVSRTEIKRSGTEIKSLEHGGGPCYAAQLNSRSLCGLGVSGRECGQEGSTGKQNPPWRSFINQGKCSLCVTCSQAQPRTRQ